MPSLVSIVIPFFNHGRYIQNSIESALNQTYNNIEVIVVNDGSNEEHSSVLKKIVTKYDNVRIVFQENQGPCSAKNNGVGEANGDYILFLDSDNELLPHYVKSGMELLLSNENAKWAFGDFEFFGDKMGVKNQGFDDKRKIIFSSQIDNCILIEKETFYSIGKFDTHLNRLGLEDWDMIISLCSKGVPFVKINSVTFKYRVVDDSRTNIEANKNLVEIKAYLAKKHCNFILNNYEDLFYEKNRLISSVDKKIGSLILAPYRLIKKLFGVSKEALRKIDELNKG